MYTITKSTIENYKLRHESGMYWADINIDAKGKTGRIQIASDFGDWQYYWGACGLSFKEFLIKLDIHYVAGKFGESHWFDIDKTIKLNKEILIDYRKREEIDEDIARKGWIELEELADCDNSNDFHNRWYEQKSLYTIFDGERPDSSYSVSPRFKEFWNKLWPVFCDELRSELKEVSEPA